MNAQPKTIDFSDPPFGIPPDVILDIPVPPSVNETRKLNKRALKAVDAWKSQCDKALMASGQYRHARNNPVSDCFEVKIILCEQKCRLDADNPIKAAIDYLRRIELIKNDDKRFMRRVVIEWGYAPKGCRMILRGTA